MFQGVLIRIVDLWQEPSDLNKARTHKYVKRVPYTDSKGKRRYRYFYKLPKGGIVSKESLIVGASFAYGEGDAKGHYHITASENGQVTIRHDETGETRTVTEEVLRSLLQGEQATPERKQEIREKKVKAVRDLLAAAEHGSRKQVIDRLKDVFDVFSSFGEIQFNSVEGMNFNQVIQRFNSFIAMRPQLEGLSFEARPERIPEIREEMVKEGEIAPLPTEPKIEYTQAAKKAVSKANASIKAVEDAIKKGNISMEELRPLFDTAMFAVIDGVLQKTMPQGVEIAKMPEQVQRLQKRLDKALASVMRYESRGASITRAQKQQLNDYKNTLDELVQQIISYRSSDLANVSASREVIVATAEKIKEQLKNFPLYSREVQSLRLRLHSVVEGANARLETAKELQQRDRERRLRNTASGEGTSLVVNRSDLNENGRAFLNRGTEWMKDILPKDANGNPYSPSDFDEIADFVKNPESVKKVFQTLFDHYEGKGYWNISDYEGEVDGIEYVSQDVQITRTINVTEATGYLNIYNDYFSMENEVRGKDTATQFYIKQEDWLRELTKNLPSHRRKQVSISILADVDVGKYLWAREGYMYKDHETRERHLRGIRVLFDTYSHENMEFLDVFNEKGDLLSMSDLISEEDYQEMMRDFETMSEDKELEPMDILTHPLANKTKFFYEGQGKKKVPCTLGKLMLLRGNQWNAKKKLHPTTDKEKEVRDASELVRAVNYQKTVSRGGSWGKQGETSWLAKGLRLAFMRHAS